MAVTKGRGEGTGERLGKEHKGATRRKMGDYGQGTRL